MKPAAVIPVINGHRVVIEIDTVTEIVSLHYELQQTRYLKIVQQFPLIQIMRAGLFWDEATSRFVVASGKKPSRAVTMAEAQSEASEVRSGTRQTSPSHVFWADQ